MSQDPLSHVGWSIAAELRARHGRLWRRFAVVVIIGWVLTTGCSGTTDSAPAVEVSGDVVADRVGEALGSLSTVRADSAITSSIDAQSAVVGRQRADVDLRVRTATSDVTIFLAPDLAEGEEQTEESVVIGDRSFRRRPGEAWNPVDDTLVGLVLPAFEEEGADVALALRTIVAAAAGPWTATTRDGITSYVNLDETDGDLIEFTIDDRGHLIGVARSQPPFGSDVDHPLRVGVETVFSDFDTVTVQIPADLPSE